MKKIILLIFSTFLLYGCVTYTGVIPMGPDTYMISEQGWIATQSTGALLAHVIKGANEYCSLNKKKMMPVSTQTVPGVLGRSYPEVQLQFMCLNDNDYELQRPKMKPMPTENKSTIDLNIKQQ